MHSDINTEHCRRSTLDYRLNERRIGKGGIFCKKNDRASYKNQDVEQGIEKLASRQQFLFLI